MKNSTKIVILLDRSGSMSSAVESTVNGLNSFVLEKKKDQEEVSLKIIQFDEFLGNMSYEVTYNSSLRFAPEFTTKDFKPRGGTPLLDAQGKAIKELGKELASLPESERPNKVIFVTITDGYENASRNFTNEQIKSLIEHQTNIYNWDFVYIAANQDAIAVGLTMGYSASKSMSYNVASAAAVGATFSNLASYTNRGSVCDPADLRYVEFEEEERSSSMTGTGNQ